jgi:hypothetical protein
MSSVCLLCSAYTRRHCDALLLVSLTALGCTLLDRERAQKILGASIHQVRSSHAQNHLQTTRASASSQQRGKQDSARQSRRYKRSIPPTTCYQPRRLLQRARSSPAAAVSPRLRIRFEDEFSTARSKSNTKHIFRYDTALCGAVTFTKH